MLVYKVFKCLWYYNSVVNLVGLIIMCFLVGLLGFIINVVVYMRIFVGLIFLKGMLNYVNEGR